MYGQERHSIDCQSKYTESRLVSTLKDHLASPSFKVLMPQAALPSRTTRAPTSGVRYKFARSDSATRKSGDQGKNAKTNDKQVRAVTEPVDLLDDLPESVELGSNEELLDVHALHNGCLACLGHHEPYQCPLIKGGVEEQRKVFQNLRDRRKPVHVVKEVQEEFLFADSGTDTSSDDADFI
jgi:hypothetical protein